MTDEEMAEKWWNNWVVKDWNDLQEGKRLFIQAFLAGLKAGRPQWYKPSEKLPERCTTVLNEDGDKVYYDYNIKCWRYDDEDLNITTPPIAWCKIPIFNKEMKENA